MGQRQSELDKSCSPDIHDGQSAADTTGSKYQSSSNMPEEEQAPPYPSTTMNSAADQTDWNDCGVPVWTSDSETQVNESPQNPFIYEGARPASVKKRKNVILFGETGVGKSSVINLMAGAEVALTSSNLDGCTLKATEYSFTLPGEMSLCIYDTVGLNEPEMGVNTFFGAIEEAHKLVTSLHDAGGIDLLLFCIRGGRITATMQRNYRLFFEFLCEKKVPLAFVVTNLEHEKVMENWWKRNEKTFEEYGIQSVAHACITATPARGTRFAAQRVESRSALQKMLRDSLSGPSSPYVKDIWIWFAGVVDMLRSSLMKSLPMSLRRWVLLKRLKTRCALSRDQAQQLADMLTGGR